MESLSSKEEEALDVAVKNLQRARLSVKMATVKKASDTIFFPEGTTRAKTIWMTKHSITRVTVWGHCHFLNNIKLAMLKEELGVGPKSYCIVRSVAPNFASKVFLLTRYLPHEKMCIFPLTHAPLKGPFLNPRRQEIGKAIANRNPPMGIPPPFCAKCYTWWCSCSHGIVLVPEEKILE